MNVVQGSDAPTFSKCRARATAPAFISGGFRPGRPFPLGARPRSAGLFTTLTAYFLTFANIRRSASPVSYNAILASAQTVGDRQRLIGPVLTAVLPLRHRCSELLLLGVPLRSFIFGHSAPVAVLCGF